MTFQFANLDPTTRGFMLREIDRDERSGRVYRSGRLTSTGQAAFPRLLREAFTDGNEASLERALTFGGYLSAYERRVVRGRPVTAKVGANAAALLAADQFNRYYIRGVCARALEEHGQQASVTVYRAKPVSHPRPESQAKIGRAVPASALLDDLRTNEEETRFGIPSGPLSGISVRLGDCVA